MCISEWDTVKEEGRLTLSPTSCMLVITLSDLNTLLLYFNSHDRFVG